MTTLQLTSTCCTHQSTARGHKCSHCDRPRLMLGEDAPGGHVADGDRLEPAQQHVQIRIPQH